MFISKKIDVANLIQSIFKLNYKVSFQKKRKATFWLLFFFWNRLLVLNLFHHFLRLLHKLVPSHG